MPEIELLTFYLIAASVVILLLLVLVLTVKVKQSLSKITELETGLKNIATKDDITLANNELSTDILNAMLLFESNMTQRSEEVLAEAIELKTVLSKLQKSQSNLPVDAAKDIDEILDDVIIFDREGLTSEEISARLNLKHEFVQDIIKFNSQH